MTNTTRLALDKPADDGSDLVDVQQDINAAYEKIDAAVGFQIVTSSTRPSSPYSGKPIAESDTSYRTYFYNGTSPASAGWVEIPNSSGTYGGNLAMASGKQISIAGAGNISLGASGQLNIGGSTSQATIAVVNPNTTYDLLSGRVTGDTQSRFVVDTDGTLNWGAGASASVDTTLYRSAANTLRTGDNLVVDLDLTVTGNLAVSGIGQRLFARKTGDTSRSSTTTMTDDPHLTVSLAASATYRLIAYIVYQAGTTGDVNIAFTIPSGAAGSWQGTGYGRDVTASIGTGGWTVRMNVNDIGTVQARSYGGDTTNQAVQVMGTVRTSSAGTFAVQWAQAASDATATILRTDSFMELVRSA